MQLTVEELETALTKNNDLNYALTAQGGAKWEAVSQPKWDRYISLEGLWKEGQRTIIATNRQLAEEYVGAYEYHQPEKAMVPGSLTWHVDQPWQATYWKQLPQAHRAQCYVVGQEMNQGPQWHEDRWIVLQQWIAKTQWFTDYWLT